MKTLWQKFKKPVIFFILFLLLLEIVFLLSPRFFSGIGFIEPVMTLPVKFFVGVKSKTVSAIDRYFFLVHTAKENEILKKELHQNEIKLMNLKEELREYRDAIQFKFYYSPITWNGVILPVIGRDISALFDSVIIYKGRLKIQPGTPVLHWRGVVGMVVSVAPFSAKVMLLTNINSSIDVFDSRSGVRGVFRGEGKSYGEVVYVPVNHDVKKGDVWITSGLDGVYPPGVNVAVTKSVKRSRNRYFYKIEALPLLDVFSFRNVFVPGVKNER